MIKSKTDKKPLPCSTNDLNNHFSTAQGNPVSDILSILQDTPDPNLNRFYFHYITLDTFLKAFYQSKSTSLGYDRISWNILETSLPVTFPTILDIINNSFTNSNFPSAWKKSVIIPLPKTKNPTNLNDFRPISLLPILSKVLERIVHNQLTSYCETNDLLDVRQAGYKKRHSTQTALLNVIDDVKRGIDERKVTIIVLFDFSKAFDLVDHRILLERLRDLNFSNQVIKWFHSYLSGRKQAVKDVSGLISSWCDILCEVPQGSVLGPSVFSLYLLSLAAVLIGMRYILYADDLQAYLSCFLPDLQEALMLVETNVHAVNNWAIANKLKLNLAKTKIMIIGSHRNVTSIDFNTLHRINIANFTIPIVKDAKNLGITLSYDLKWSDQVKDISRKIFGCLRRFRCSERALSFHVRVSLVSAIICPYLDYCCLVLLDNTAELDLVLQRALNASIRFIFKLRKFEHITPFYARLNWLTVQKRRLYFLGSLMYQIKCRQLPSYLFDIINTPPPVHNYNLRRSVNNLRIPFARTESFRKSFTNMGPRF